MLPLAWLALESQRSWFLSNQHAHLVAKALLVRDRGRVELLGFVYPPLPFFLLLPWPRPVLASLWAVGFAAWLALELWQILSRRQLPWLPAFLVWLALVASPSFLYLATQGMSETLTLVLLVLAWQYYLRFTRGQTTREGFIAGLLLGLAFFAHYYAVAYGFVFALLVPGLWRERRPQAWLAASFVMLFPIIWGVGSWIYLNALFTPDPLRFLRDPTSSLFVYTALPSEAPIIGWPMAVSSVLLDLWTTPLYLTVLFLLVWTPRRALGVYLTPLLLILVARAWGLLYPPAFARLTLTLMALIGMPRLRRPGWGVALALAALAQLLLSWWWVPPGEPRMWLERLRRPLPSPQDREELVLAGMLRDLPRGSVLTDDRVAYRVIARTGSARPFLLPPDTRYLLAESAPQAFVAYLLVPVQPVANVPGRVSQVYPQQPPPGFQVRYQGQFWLLYQRQPP